MLTTPTATPPPAARPPRPRLSAASTRDLAKPDTSWSTFITTGSEMRSGPAVVNGGGRGEGGEGGERRGSEGLRG